MDQGNDKGIIMTPHPQDPKIREAAHKAFIASGLKSFIAEDGFFEGAKWMAYFLAKEINCPDKHCQDIGCVRHVDASIIHQLAKELS